MPAKVVDPAFRAELTHQSVDPGKTCDAKFPASKPFLRLGAVDAVGPCDESTRGDGRGKVPRYKAAIRIIVSLGKRIAKRRLGAKIHVTKQQLTEKVGGNGGCFVGFIGSDDIVSAPVKLAHRE